MSAATERGAARIASVVEHSPDAVRLARVASLAVRIEPHLLRRLRLKLLRDVDVGAEADLWFSPLVESRGVDAIVLDRDVVEILREEIEPSSLGSVVAIVSDAHAYEPATLRLEEKVNALAVAGKRAALDEIDRELRGAIVAMRESDARAREIARWFLRAAPRLHPVVQEAPNAIALLLSASMLLGRRSSGAVRESRLTLKDLGWVLTSDVLSTRVDVGVERLPDAVRFVAAGAEGSGTISLPPTEPRLVEVGWSVTGTAERRVIEATPGSVVTIGTNASDVRVVTLAGDEYELVPVAGTESAPAASTVDLTPYREIAAACVQVTRPTDPRAVRTATRVHPHYVFTAREQFGQSQVMINDTDPERQRGFVPMPDYDELVAVESTSEDVRPVQLATAPFTARQVQAEDPPERQSERAVVLGYAGDSLLGLEGEAEIDDFTGNAFRVLVRRPPFWISGLAGGPVIIDGHVRGIVNAVHVPTMSGTAILSVVGAERIQDLLRRVLDQERAQAAQSVESPAQNAPVVNAGPEPPSWLLDVCVTIRSGGAEDPPTTGLVISDRLVVSTAVELRDREDITVSTRQGTLRGRVIDYGAGGPLVYIGLTGAERFEHTAPLIRQSRRVRAATDAPDPPDAMLVVGHAGLRMLRVKDAQAAGVLHARDPEGYRFEVDIAEPESPVGNFNNAVLVWGEAVAGLVVRQLNLRPGSSDHAPRARVEVLSVNTLRESLDDVTRVLDSLTPPATLRAFVSSTLRDLAGHRQRVSERLAAHGIESVAAETWGADRDAPAKAFEMIDRSDVFILLVGSRFGFVPEGEEKSVTQLELDRARVRGLDVLVFLSRDDSGIQDRALLAWRDELQKHYQVQFFEESPESLRIDEAILKWQKTRARTTANVDAPPAAETPSAASGHHFAKVVLCGPEGAGKTRLLRRIAPLNFTHGDQLPRHGIRWVERPSYAPALHTGLIFYEALADENWPLALDLERAALAVVVVPFQSKVEPAIRSQTQRARAANAAIPVIVVITHADADLGSRTALLDQLRDVQHVFFVTTRNVEQLAGGDVSSLLEGIIKRIAWDRQEAVSPTDFDKAKKDQAETFEILLKPDNTIDEWRSKPTWLQQFGALLGERVLTRRRPWILHPGEFEEIVLAIVDRARKRTEGLPATRLGDVPMERSRYARDGRELVDAVVRELEAKSLALVVGSGLQTVIVLPSLLETADEVRVPTEAGAILRADWTGNGRDVFAAVLAHYAYELQSTVEAGWQTNLSSGSAKISGRRTLFLKVSEAGAVAELLATAGDEFGSSKFGSSSMDGNTAAVQLREVIESVLQGNASLSVQLLQGPQK